MGQLVPLQPIFDGSQILLKGEVGITDSGGNVHRAGDLYPTTLQPEPLTWNLFAENSGSILTPLFDPRTDNPDTFFKQQSLYQLGVDNPDLIGEIPTGSCMHIQIFGVLFEWRSPSSPYGDACDLLRTQGTTPRLMYDYWDIVLPTVSQVHSPYYGCDGINPHNEDHWTFPNVQPICRDAFGCHYHDQSYCQVIGYAVDCSHLTTPEVPEMVSPPIPPYLPSDVPPPPPPPSAVPKLYGGVVTNVLTPEEATTEFVPHSDGFALNISVYCPCTDGAPGADGAPGPQGPPGTNGLTPMVPYNAEIPVYDPIQAKYVIRTKSIHVPSDGSGADMADLFNSLFNIIIAMWSGMPPPVVLREDVGIGQPDDSLLA